MKPADFWNSTMYEIRVYIEAIRNKEECKFKDLHYLASLIRLAVVSAFDKDVKVPAFEDVMNGGTGTAEKTNIYHGWEDSKAYMKAVQSKQEVR